MRKPVLLVATWSVGTLLAVALAWWAVGRVSSEVVDRPSAPISDREVAAALAAEPGAATTVPAGGSGPGDTTTAPGTPAGGPAPTTPPASAAPTTGGSAPASAPTSTPTTAAPTATGTTAVIDSVGGQVAVRYGDGRVELVWARPRAGFEAEVHDAGPEDVEVRFDGDNRESRVRAFLRDGVPDREVREEDDGGDDG